MSKFAAIKNGLVDNIIISDLKLDNTWVEATDDVVIGWIFDNGAFYPQPVAESQPVRILTKLQYMNRFTDEELAGIYAAAKSVVQVEIWLEKFKLASEIDLDDQRTVAGVQALEASGLIAAGRAAEILSGAAQ